jgi:hypothetical protein
MIRRLIPCVALGLAHAAAAAQDPPQPADNSEILVSGIREMEREIEDFVGALTEAPVRGQLSRFETRAVCPLAVGISAADKQAVASRMRRVAEAAGIWVGGATCIPNVVVIVTSDKRAFIEALARRYPYYFGDMPDREVRALANGPGRAAAWQVPGPPLDADGAEMSDTNDVYVNRTSRRGSRITAGARPHFAAAVVVVERGALVGLTTTQLADYAAMRAFARTDPSRLAESAAPTILKILDAPMGSEVPITMTQWDLGFLRGLYASPENLYAPSQRSAIRRRLENELQPGESRN